MSNCTLFMTTKLQCMCIHLPASATRFGWIDGCAYAKPFVMYIKGTWQMVLAEDEKWTWQGDIRRGGGGNSCSLENARLSLSELFSFFMDLSFVSALSRHSLCLAAYPYDSITSHWISAWCNCIYLGIYARRCIRRKQK